MNQVAMACKLTVTSVHYTCTMDVTKSYNVSLSETRRIGPSSVFACFAITYNTYMSEILAVETTAAVSKTSKSNRHLVSIVPRKTYIYTIIGLSPLPPRDTTRPMPSNYIITCRTRRKVHIMLQKPLTRPRNIVKARSVARSTTRRHCVP